jgi:hypothetical protein
MGWHDDGSEQEAQAHRRIAAESFKRIQEAKRQDKAVSEDSNAVALPPLDSIPEDWAHTGNLYSMEGYRAATRCRERQLRDALAQIAALTAQVEELERKGCEVAAVLGNLGIHIHDLGLRNDGEMGQWKYCNERAEKAEAELAALREGAKVTYRVDAEVRGLVLAVRGPYSVLEDAKEAYSQRRSTYASGNASLIEVITRERILDTEACGTCGEPHTGDVPRNHNFVKKEQP